MKNKCFHCLLLCVLTLNFDAPLSRAANGIRNEFPLPDIPGWITLKCDFHMHTVFSDGLVWPTVRVAEAWRDGLDAIAITDHVEYQPHKMDVSTNYDRSYDLAKPVANSLGLLLIKSAEITRPEPPGHLNALFVTCIDDLKKTNYLDAVGAAASQGAFLFWNHPGWKQPGNKSVWYKEQGEFLEKGWLKGIEIVNGADYDPIAHQWCVDNKLARLGDSDAHNPIDMDYNAAEKRRRPMTLVFAKERTLESIHEAMAAGRTAVYSNNNLYGDEEFLLPLFYGSIEVKALPLSIKSKGKALMQVFNRSGIDFNMESNGKLEELSFPAKISLPAGKTRVIELQGKSETTEGTKALRLPFKVRNLVPAPRKPLPVEFKVTIQFLPK